MHKILSICLLLIAGVAQALPSGFVYLGDVSLQIVQDMRYAGYHNFIGRPIAGYHKGTCILTQPAAQGLQKVEAELVAHGLSLKVYDCYRPQMAVDDFYHWSQDPSQQQMKAEFYPRIDKARLFDLGYIARQSGHSRGSTMDLTIVPLPTPVQPPYKQGQALVACYAPYGQRYHDNSIDMGTGFDCLDTSAHIDNHDLSATAYHNRLFLRQLMIKYGFVPYDEEWWHFTLKNEPYPQQAFNFTVE